MTDRVPTTFLLVAGPWVSANAVLEAVHTAEPAARLRSHAPIATGEVGVEFIEDPDIAGAFAWGRTGPLPEPVTRSIAQAGRAALVEVGLRLDEDPQRLTRIGLALRDSGGLAIRVEASGGASTWDDWLPRMQRGHAVDLYTASVIVVRGEHDTCFTCGMHAFDLPDAEIALPEASSSLEWLDAFCVYQLAEQPALGSGHTFRPHDGAAKRTLERWPDHRHHPDDGRHNPFGVWRFLPEGASRVEASAQVPMIVPPLVAMLASVERKRQRPLTRAEVEELVDKASAIAMARTDAIVLERSRGYADIEPALAWDQWQMVRTRG